MQPYINKAISCLALWKGKFLNHTCCVALVKSVLFALPISLLAALKVDGRTIKVFDKDPPRNVVDMQGICQWGEGQGQVAQGLSFQGS
jgi:hypothetical protein